ncbi:unnamed protein product [Closterium sp. Naga37s-1]|nr:unnamed protein product [Closterium sp. Naga37s-1]
MAQPMPFCWQIRTPQISDLGLIWLDGIGGDARHLLLEDKETGDVLFPLVTLTSRFQRGHSRKLSSLAYRVVVLPDWPMARAGEGSSRKRKQRGDAEGGSQRKAVAQVGDMGGEVSLVPLPVVYNSMARRPGIQEHKFFRILYRAIRLTSYYHVLKHPPGMEQALVDHHCPAFPPPLVRTNGTRRCSRCNESPMRGPASLQHTFVKYTLPVHDADNDLLLAYRLLPIARFVPLHACSQRWQQLQHVRTQQSGESEGQEGEEDAVLGIQSQHQVRAPVALLEQQQQPLQQQQQQPPQQQQQQVANENQG